MHNQLPWIHKSSINGICVVFGVIRHTSWSSASITYIIRV